MLVSYIVFLIVMKARPGFQERKKERMYHKTLSDEETARWNIIEWEKQKLREQEARYFDAWYARAKEFPDQTEPWERANPIMNPDLSVDEIYQDPDEYYRKKWGDYPKSA
ncbi:MAG: hypothetical protein ACMUHB_01695 [Thermoplasmatota archaeon]